MNTLQSFVKIKLVGKTLTGLGYEVGFLPAIIKDADICNEDYDTNPTLCLNLGSVGDVHIPLNQEIFIDGQPFDWSK